MESIVLLENRNGILPMDLSKYKNVAIIGPCADDPTCSEGDSIFLHAHNTYVCNQLQLSLVQVIIILDQSIW